MSDKDVHAYLGVDYVGSTIMKSVVVRGEKIDDLEKVRMALERLSVQVIAMVRAEMEAKAK